MGDLELIVGCMFSGKTNELFRRIRMELVSERKVQLFKPLLDNRYSQNLIVSHDKLNLEAVPVSSTNELIQKLDYDTEVVGIDEIQFFDDKIIDFCLNQTNKNIIASGLNLNFRGEPFKFRNSSRDIGDLLPYAVIKYLRAICKYKEDSKICGRSADFSQRLIEGKPAPYNSELILVGSKDKYEARCKQHFYIEKPNEK